MASGSLSRLKHEPMKSSPSWATALPSRSTTTNSGVNRALYPDGQMSSARCPVRLSTAQARRGSDAEPWTVASRPTPMLQLPCRAGSVRSDPVAIKLHPASNQQATSMPTARPVPGGNNQSGQLAPPRTPGGGGQARRLRVVGVGGSVRGGPVRISLNPAGNQQATSMPTARRVTVVINQSAFANVTRRLVLGSSRRSRRT